MIRGMATYIADTADIPTYVKTSQRTGQLNNIEQGGGVGAVICDVKVVIGR